MYIIEVLNNRNGIEKEGHIDRMVSNRRYKLLTEWCSRNNKCWSGLSR